MNAAIATDPGKFYVWHASDEFAIHLNIKAIARLKAHVSRAANRGGGGELQGILLGRDIEEPFRATVVEDFQLVEPGEGGGTGLDAGALQVALREAQSTPEGRSDHRAVGFFRSRRDGRLNMNAADLEILGNLFGASGNVALLIQTSRGNESDAALFYCSAEGVRPSDFGFGFPFDAEQLATGHPGWRYPDPIDRTPVAASAPSSQAAASAVLPLPSLPRISDFTMPPPPIPPSAESGIRWGRLAPTLILAGLAIATLQFAANRGSSVSAAAPEPPPAAASVSDSAAPNDHPGLGLTVKALPHQLEIRWNRESGAITAADKGVIKITDEGVTKSYPFDQSQLQDAYIAYIPKTSDVTIELEVKDKDGATTSEAVRTVAIP